MAKKQGNIEQIFKDFGDGLKTALDKVLEVVFKPASVVASVGQFATALQGSLATALTKGISAALAPVSAAIQVFAVGTSREVQQMRAMVEKANPAAVFKFDRALDDLAATIGQILLPVFETVTGFIREFADVMQGLKPALAPIMQTISMTIQELTKLIVPISGLLIPVLAILDLTITTLVVPAIKLMILALEGMVKAFNEATFNMFKLEKQSSVGAAVRPAAYSKVEDIGKRTTLAALQSQQGSSDPQKQMVEEQKKSVAWLEKIDKSLSVLSPVYAATSYLPRQLISIFD